MRASWLPLSVIWPPFTTRMRSESLIVLRRCAMVKVVRPCRAASSACCTSFSDAESSADVASSRRSTLGCRRRARAMAQRCFWPPLSFSPRMPTLSCHATVPFRA
mmetsp:Transcript_36921/g.95302  ORF Transcript_36921/g.95302 Transcript_36921/m.95302 type:complete len:105 (+) Transcript_36921:70-384(+)